MNDLTKEWEDCIVSSNNLSIRLHELHKGYPEDELVKKLFKVVEEADFLINDAYIVWDDHMNGSECNTCGGTGRWISSLEDDPTQLVDLGPCPDCPLGKDQS